MHVKSIMMEVSMLYSDCFFNDPENSILVLLVTWFESQIVLLSQHGLQRIASLEN